jgi:outer membrane protein
MKRLLSITIMLCAVLCLSAQDSTQVSRLYGYLSYEKVLHALPDYSIVQQQLNELRTQYENELKRAEQDFNLKYEEFLEGQRDFPESILRKRQTELKELLERNIAFKAESRQQLAQAEAELMEPLRLRLADALERIGMERGYAFILNTDANAVPFINPAQGEDVSEAVILLMK